MPRRRSAWASWNYHLTERPTGRTTVTYDMNRLQSLEADRDLLVTLNRTEAIDPGRVIRVIDYAHPVFTPEGVAAQSRWPRDLGPATNPLLRRVLEMGLPRGRRLVGAARLAARSADAGPSTRPARPEGGAATPEPSASSPAQHDRIRDLRGLGELTGGSVGARMGSATACSCPSSTSTSCPSSSIPSRSGRPADRRPRASIARTISAGIPPDSPRVLAIWRQRASGAGRRDPCGCSPTPAIWGWGSTRCRSSSCYGRGRRLGRGGDRRGDEHPVGRAHRLRPRRHAAPAAGRWWAHSEKEMHVSPFEPMDQRYEISVTPPGAHLAVRITSFEAGLPVFSAQLALRRREITRRAMAGLLLRYPPMTAHDARAHLRAGAETVGEGRPALPASGTALRAGRWRGRRRSLRSSRTC